MAVGLVTSLLAMPLVRAIARRGGLLDHPSARSSRRTVTPRGGGLAVMASLGAALLLRQSDWTATPAVLVLLAGAAAVARVGLRGDRFGLPPLSRFLSHLAPALVLSGKGVAGARRRE